MEVADPELVAVVVEPELVVEEAEAIVGFSSPRDSSLRLGKRFKITLRCLTIDGFLFNMSLVKYSIGFKKAGKIFSFSLSH